jgi:hypothetical protein
MKYAFVCRVLIDTKEEVDCYRDIEVLPSQNLKDFHAAIIDAFGYDKLEMASFYTVTDDWEKMDEYPLFDIMDSGDTTMDKMLVGDILSGKEDKLLLVYDYMKMWSFLIECINETEEQEKGEYPKLLLSSGTPPDVSTKEDFADQMLTEESLTEDDDVSFGDSGSVDDLDEESFDFDEYKDDLY